MLAFFVVLVFSLVIQQIRFRTVFQCSLFILRICVALDACGCSVWQLFGGKANLPQINLGQEIPAPN